MIERHENEQYFFDPPTVDHLAQFLSRYEHPCCLCAPMVGQALVKRGVAVTILDIDERFAHLPGFRRYDIYRPTWLGDEFGIIICDPPFFNVSLSQLFAAIRLLSRNDFSQQLLISYLARRADNILGTFAHFGLQRMGYKPGYQTVQRAERNEIEFFGNFASGEHHRLLFNQ